MPSLIDEFRAANRTLSARAERDLLAFWATLDLTKPERARDALLRFIPTLTTLYGQGAATVAADWYDELRAVERIPGRFAATVAAPFATDYVEQRVRFGAAHLFTDAPSEMLPFLDGVVQEYVLQPGRDTIQQSAKADPRAVGWHRETSPGACKFCRMLAGKGGVYHKESSATFAAHGDCNCSARPSWDADAPQVPAVAYVASTRMDKLRARAASGDVSAQRQLDANRQRVKNYLDSMDE